MKYIVIKLFSNLYVDSSFPTVANRDGELCSEGVKAATEAVFSPAGFKPSNLLKNRCVGLEKPLESIIGISKGLGNPFKLLFCEQSQKTEFYVVNLEAFFLSQEF
jgi:hypothetical protein